MLRTNLFPSSLEMDHFLTPHKSVEILWRRLFSWCRCSVMWFPEKAWAQWALAWPQQKFHETREHFLNVPRFERSKLSICKPSTGRALFGYAWLLAHVLVHVQFGLATYLIITSLHYLHNMYCLMMLQVTYKQNTSFWSADSNDTYSRWLIEI